jgi:hypothetical protein
VGRANGNNCTIESLEYGGNAAAAIFMIPDEQGKGSTTVVWANPADDDEEQGGK